MREPCRYASSLALSAALAVSLGCESGSQDTSGGERIASTKDEDSIFRDVTEGSGVDFIHFTGATGRFYFPEIMGAGVAVFDYDADGDLDVYLAQGAMPTAGGRLADALYPPTDRPPKNRLYRNDLSLAADGTRQLRFTDVTDRSHTGHSGYAMGVAVGDYDDDGDDDLYVTNLGTNALFRNNADGTFADVSDEAGIADPRWSTSASFLDYDADGDLDLFHTNYVAFAEDVERVCRRPTGELDYCTPLAYRPIPDALFRNNGDGTFVEVTESAGLAGSYGNGLGVIGADFDDDGWVDIFVANDGVANQLWMNRGNGTFEESGLLSGAALNESGEAEAGMGVAAGDLDADGDLDLFLAHLAGESNTLYINQGGAVFGDLTSAFALGPASRRMTGFGTHFVDYDGDTGVDIIVVNGAVTKVDSQLGEAYPYMMRNQLFHRTAPDRFEDLSHIAGEAFGRLESSRGLAVGDLDLDGDADLVMTNNNGAARVLLNQVGSRNHWLTIARDPRSPPASSLWLTGDSRVPQVRRPHTDGSYCSARDDRAYFGLGESDSAVEVAALWPRGRRIRWRDLPIDRRLVVSRSGPE